MLEMLLYFFSLITQVILLKSRVLQEGLLSKKGWRVKVEPLCSQLQTLLPPASPPGPLAATSLGCPGLPGCLLPPLLLQRQKPSVKLSSTPSLHPRTPLIWTLRCAWALGGGCFYSDFLLAEGSPAALALCLMQAAAPPSCLLQPGPAWGDSPGTWMPPASVCMSPCATKLHKLLSPKARVLCTAGSWLGCNLQPTALPAKPPSTAHFAQREVWGLLGGQT